MTNQTNHGAPGADDNLVVLADYPELARLAWNRDGCRAIEGKEALQLYEAGWRHVDEASLTQGERELIRNLVERHGNGVLQAMR